MEPKVIGYTDIPTQKQENTRARHLVSLLVPGKALALELPSREDCRQYRRTLLTAAERLYGNGKVQTTIEGKQVKVWLREEMSILTADEHQALKVRMLAALQGGEA